VRAIERRQAILELLCSRRYEKVNNLAFEFEVTEKTIRNDLMELSLTYPIYTQQGTNGGVYVAEGFYLGTIYLNSEQKEVLEALKGMANKKQQEVLDSILKSFTRPKRRCE